MKRDVMAENFNMDIVEKRSNNEGYKIYVVIIYLNIYFII
jgi:hypothetical protein